MIENVKLEEAQGDILSLVIQLPGESVPLAQALGRVIHNDLYATNDLPVCAQSAVDGYAVPVSGKEACFRYLVKESLLPGQMPGFGIGPGESTGVVTGGPLSAGAGAVIPCESVKCDGEHISFRGAISLGDNIKSQGEDFCKGDLLARGGDIVNPGTVGVLAAFGMNEVVVSRVPRVAILGLGKEVVPCSVAPLPGQIRDCNGPLLAAFAQRDGAFVTAMETAGAKSPSNVKSLLENMLWQADMVLTTGGTASGVCDQAMNMVRQTGARLLFWGVRIKPGSHSGAAIYENKVIISLSGNPAACAAGYHLLAAPVLRALQGLGPYPKRLSAVCKNSFPKKGGPRRFVQGILSCSRSGLEVTIVPGQKSSMLRGLLNNGNVLIDLPAGHRPVEAGAKVQVILLNPCAHWEQ